MYVRKTSSIPVPAPASQQQYRQQQPQQQQYRPQPQPQYRQPPQPPPQRYRPPAPTTRQPRYRTPPPQKTREQLERERREREWFERQARERQLQEQRQQQQHATSNQSVTAQPKPTATKSAQAKALASHQQRVQQQREIKRLRNQNWQQVDIATAVGVSRRTVQRLLTLPDFPETPPRRPTFGRGILDPYKPMVLKWWNAGNTQSKVLMGLLRLQGYTGTLRTLQRYLCSLRQAQGLPTKRVLPKQGLPNVIDLQLPSLTARRAAYLLIKRAENRDDDEAERVTLLAQQHPDLARAVQITDEFLDVLRHQLADRFDTWLFKGLTCRLKPFQKFAEGLLDDYAAVKASLLLPVSNGPVEGLNNKLKMLKRQMYGRASLELLEKRFVMAA